MQLEYWRLGPTVSSVSELFRVPNPLHNAYMGLTQSHLCWWLLAALPVRLLEWGCLIPKQCLLLPVSPLPICVDLLTHVGTRGTVLALFLCMALASRGVRIDLRAGRESRVAWDVCSLLTTVRPGSVWATITGSNEPIILCFWFSSCSLGKMRVHAFIPTLPVLYQDTVCAEIHKELALGSYV